MNTSSNTALKQARKELQEKVRALAMLARHQNFVLPVKALRAVEHAIDNLIAEAQAAVVLEKTTRR